MPKGIYIIGTSRSGSTALCQTLTHAINGAIGVHQPQTTLSGYIAKYQHDVSAIYGNVDNSWTSYLKKKGNTVHSSEQGQDSKEVAPSHKMSRTILFYPAYKWASDEKLSDKEKELLKEFSGTTFVFKDIIRADTDYKEYTYPIHTREKSNSLTNIILFREPLGFMASWKQLIYTSHAERLNKRLDQISFSKGTFQYYLDSYIRFQQMFPAIIDSTAKGICITYDDLVTNPNQVLSSILEHCQPNNPVLQNTDAHKLPAIETPIICGNRKHQKTVGGIVPSGMYGPSAISTSLERTAPHKPRHEGVLTDAEQEIIEEKLFALYSELFEKTGPIGNR